MDSDSPHADVEEELRDTAEAMSDRFASLKEEVSTTGTSVRDWVLDNPWKSVGGMLAVGVAVGALFGRNGSRRRSEHAELLDRYATVLRNEMEEAIAAGRSPSEALETVLRDRVPLVVLNSGEEPASDSGGSVIGSSLGFLARTIAREVVRDQIFSMLDSLGGEGDLGEDLVDDVE